MSGLWKEKNAYQIFDGKQHHINETCGGGKRSFLPYQRLYKKLTDSELLELIQDAKTFQWQALDLEDCGLNNLPKELWSLSELKLLYLGNSNHAGNNKNVFLHIPKEIENLSKLQVLSLGGSNVEFEEENVLDLPQLVHLDIFNCGFAQIPQPLLVPSIQEIGFNCLEQSLSESFLTLKNLRHVYLTFSTIEFLPENIDSLGQLRKLYLYKSKIERLPNAITKLKYLSVLELEDTPIANSVPPEILNQSGKEIVRYIFSQLSNAPKYYFNESKMVIVGQGHVGKTTLLNRLIHNTYISEGSTEGIDITSWTFKRKGNTYKLNVWDFGGQEIYHSTHQFFLTNRSLYLLVWDAFAEDEYGRIDYWLKTIQSLAGDSPIIIVVNKCDQDVGRIRRIDDIEYKERFPQVKDIVYVSCKDNIGISELRKNIKNIAVDLPLMATSWLSSWMNIRKELEDLSKTKNHIAYSEYLEICKKYDVNYEEGKSLLKYLHDLGIVLYYHEDMLLKNLVILSSEWGTDAVYKVLDEQEGRLKNRNGVLHSEDLQLIWSDAKKYPPERYPHLLSLMRKFQLIFDMTDSTYLVAELLNNVTIKLPYTFLRDNSLAFRYEYDFIPAGIMTKFIVAINPYLETIDGIKQCWKKGAYLKHHSAYALVKLFDNLSERYIEIKVSGAIPRERQELLTIIRMAFDNINSQYNQINIAEKIPCVCSDTCNFMFDYSKLLYAESISKQTMECHNTLSDVSVKKLLDGVETNMESNYGGPNITYVFSPQNNTQINPQINPQFNNTATSHAEASNSNNITVEVKNTILTLHGDINDLISETKNQSPEFDEICQKISATMDELGQYQTQEEIIKSGAMKKIERFIAECTDSESKTGKFLSGIKHSANILKSIASGYNKVAKLLLLPQIPFIN